MKTAIEIENNELMLITEEDSQNYPDSVSANESAEVFGELREISQKLHGALHHLELDSTVIGVTREKIPDAMNGLDYVIEKTAEAANQTLDLVEDSMPISSELATRARSLQEDWGKLRQRELDYEQFKPLSDALSIFLSDIGEMSSKLSANLSAILLAQEFQDLTGQVIRRVMDDVKSVDEQLSNFAMDPIRDRTSKTVNENQTAAACRGQGPVIDRGADKNLVPDQNAVDDILSDLDL